MIDLIMQHRAELEELCQKYQVKTLEVFGSAANGSWDPERSDQDFLVDFLSRTPGQHSRSYFGLWFALQDLFGRPVDLVETPAIRNTSFLKTVDQSRQVLYAA